MQQIQQQKQMRQQMQQQGPPPDPKMIEAQQKAQIKNAKPDSELIIIKNMNHVLKNIEKDEDNLASYYSADFPISKELIKTIVEFIHK